MGHYFPPLSLRRRASSAFRRRQEALPRCRSNRIAVVLPTAPLYPVVPPLLPVIQMGFEWLLLLLGFLVLPFAYIALDIASRPQWRKGRWLAIIGVGLPGIVLVLYGALLVYLLFFWHPHFHFVG